MNDRLHILRRFADRVLESGRDRWHGTPLLADGINLQTREPVKWIRDGKEWIICNPACQMNLFRTLVALSNLSGESRYRNAAEAEINFYFENHVDSNGLPYWGGHWFVDLASGSNVGEAPLHEFKSAYPYYEFLHEVNPSATKRMIAALWNAHVLDWSKLDMTRHGTFNAPMGPLWNSPYTGSEVFFEGKGLTFIRAGSDLVYAAGLLHHFTREPGPLTWARRLAFRYVEARDPLTHLGAYQYSQPIASAGRGQAGTNSAGGDRARNQLGPEFGERALEGKVFDPMRGEAVNASAAIVQLRLSELLGDAGKEFVDWSVSGMLAYAKYAYDPETNLLRSMFTDGTIITPEDVKRPGYYGPGAFALRKPSSNLIYAFALAWRITQNPQLWQTARIMLRHASVGDIGSGFNQNAVLDANTRCDDPVVLLTLLEIARAGDGRAYVEVAQTIADNIISMRMRDDLFVTSQKHANARFAALEPLAIASLEAMLRGKSDAVATYNSGQCYIQAPFDGAGRATDSGVIWAKLET